MRVQAQVSIYPLKTKALAKPVEEFCRRLRNPGLTVDTHSMSTLIVGESDGVFQAVKQAFQALAADFDIVVDLKVSNACPNDIVPQCRKKVD